MPFRVAMADEIVVVTFFGIVTGADFERFAAELFALERLRPTPPSRVTDLSEATALEVDFSDMSALATHRRGKRYPRAFKSAIIAPTPVQFGLARMFQTLNDHPQVAIRVFREPAEAWAWVRAADEPDPAH
ncbi:MAG: STAS/SEC14 domain-containing protein [Verrucomicrobia bacterium]|nr:STAS/SEC14 domain-containing protein [Verrucomicrobiota bacterium]